MGRWWLQQDGGVFLKGFLAQEPECLGLQGQLHIPPSPRATFRGKIEPLVAVIPLVRQERPELAQKLQVLRDLFMDRRSKNCDAPLPRSLTEKDRTRPQNGQLGNGPFGQRRNRLLGRDAVTLQYGLWTAGATVTLGWLGDISSRPSCSTLGRRCGAHIGGRFRISSLAASIVSGDAGELGE